MMKRSYVYDDKNELTSDPVVIPFFVFFTINAISITCIAELLISELSSSQSKATLSDLEQEKLSKLITP